MIIRSQSGQSLSLAIAMSVVIALLGTAFVFLSQYLGGAKEAQNSVDASCLNMTKEVSKNVGIDLKDGVEKDNFAALVDADTKKSICSTITALLVKHWPSPPTRLTMDRQPPFATPKNFSS